MSTLSATNLKNASSGSNNVVLNSDGSTTVSNDLKFNSGYGSAATAYGCRAWVNFDGTTASPSTIRGSGNVSSMTKTATGTYTMNFTNAMPDANYSVVGTSSDGTAARICGVGATPSTTSVGIVIINSSFGKSDYSYGFVAIFR